MGREKRNKCCVKCGEDSWQPNGVGNWRCSPCLVQQRRARYEANKESILEQNKKWAIENRSASNAIKKSWTKRNPLLSKTIRDIWRASNKNLINSYTSSRRKRIRVATPNWFSELDELIVREMYLQSIDLKSATGIDFHVDHIIPLKGYLVCGLHVPSNMRIVTAQENLEKSNAY